MGLAQFAAKVLHRPPVNLNKTHATGRSLWLGSGFEVEDCSDGMVAFLSLPFARE